MLSSAVRTARKNNGVKWEPYASSGCVLWLPGQDDPQSSTIRDRSGYGNNGTIAGAAWKRLNSGLWYLYFDGSGDYVDLGDSDSLDIGTSDITIEMWVRRDVYEANQRLYVKRKASNQWYDLYFTSGDAIYSSIAVNSPTIGASTYSFGSTVTDNSWRHIVSTFDRDGNGQITVNGVQGGSGDISANAGDLSNDAKAFVGAFGTDAGPPASQVLTGGIALSRLYNRILAASEIAAHYQQERSLFGV